MVSALQGSTSLAEAQTTAREVLKDFSKPLEDDLAETRANADKFSAANKVLGRALHIMSGKLGEAQRQASEFKEKLAETEERLRQTEHALNVLRWHLRSERPVGGIHTPPNIF